MPLARDSLWNDIMKLGPLTLNGSFSTRTTPLQSRTRSTDDTGALTDTPLYKRLRNLQEGVQRLQTMASPASLRKQGAMTKIAYLKQRLDALKAMLLYATPAMAKALAREVRSIAGELASIAKSLGGGSSGGGNATAVTPIPTATDSAPSDAASAEPAPTDSNGDASAEASAAQTADSAAATTTPQSSTSAPDQDKAAGTASVTGSETPAPSNASNESKASKESPGHNDREASDDNETALKAALQEARKRLKEVINLLKAKLNPADKDAKHTLQAIEKSLSELDSALQQNTVSPAASEMSTYSVAGELSAEPASSGAAVDTAA